MVGRGRYILDGKRAVLEPDLMRWAAWLEDADRQVAKTEAGETRVSTLFLGLDHNFGGGPPLLFETMVFGGPEDQYQRRYSTWEEAEAGHAEVVERVTATAGEGGCAKEKNDV